MKSVGQDEQGDGGEVTTGEGVESSQGPGVTGVTIVHSDGARRREHRDREPMAAGH